MSLYDTIWNIHKKVKFVQDRGRTLPNLMRAIHFMPTAGIAPKMSQKLLSGS